MTRTIELGETNFALYRMRQCTTGDEWVIDYFGHPGWVQCTGSLTREQARREWTRIQRRDA